jgi:hypothetical protein
MQLIFSVKNIGDKKALKKVLLTDESELSVIPSGSGS